MNERADTQPETYELSEELRARCDELVAKYPEKRAALIPVLHEIQEREGWLPHASLVAAAEYLELPLVEVYGVVTFYPLLRTRKPGRHVVQVCHNISCHLRGAQKLLGEMCAKLEIGPGGTSADGAVTVETIECLGACSEAPMMSVDGEYHMNLTPEKAVEIVEDLRKD